MDRITTSMLTAFSAEAGITTASESEAFEHFANHCVVCREYSDTFNFADISTGKATGIDGIAIIVNGSLVSSADEIADLCKANKFIDATFIFIQAKTSASFDGGQIGTFFFAVKDFFSESPELPPNESVKEAREIFDAILKNSAFFTKGKPLCKLYFVTTGKWTNEDKLVARIKSETADLQSTGLFRDVAFEPVDADRLQTLYSDTKSKISATFEFPRRAALPPIGGVSQAHIGALEAKQYVRLITDGTGNIRKSLFYDNVRDFQDYNEVNEDIRSTLKSTTPDRFAILNNGVTIVAKEFRSVGDTVHMDDYQVVNGCQTSHVLFDEKDNLSDNVFITLKVICTEDDSVTNAIIKATNYQTQVTVEQLAALSDFQKTLEMYYQTFTAPAHRLYYERRSRQFGNTPGIAKNRIVTVREQIKAFASMFLNVPHKAGRYYGTLLTDNLKYIFLPSHHPSPYYTSAFAVFRLESLFRNGQLDYGYRKFRDPLIMALRVIVAGDPPPDCSNNRKIEQYCDQILSVLWDDAQALAAFKQSTTIIDKLGGIGADRSVVKTSSFTAEVLKQAKAAAAQGVI